MKHPIIVRALQLADECGRLRVQNARLRLELATVREAHRRAVDDLEQARRDLELVGLMARDPKVAWEFIQSRHNLHRLPEVAGHGNE